MAQCVGPHVPKCCCCLSWPGLSSVVPVSIGVVVFTRFPLSIVVHLCQKFDPNLRTEDPDCYTKEWDDLEGDP